MQELLLAVQNETGIRVTEQGLRRVIGALLSEGEFWGSLRFANEPFNLVAEICKYLQEKEYIYFSGSRILLTEAGDQWLNQNKIQPIIPSVCKTCQGKAVELTKFTDLLATLKHITLSRPSSIIDYDQGYVTEETTVARVALLAQQGDIQNKDILVLGDDDLLSIAAGLSRLPRRVIVVEIDPRIVDFIDKIAKKQDLPVEARIVDLRNPLPSDLLKSFDTFLTDPPETLKALELFISRGIAGLKGPGCAGYFGVTNVESSKVKWKALEEALILKHKVVITDMIRNFNEYVNWKHLLSSIRNDIDPVKVEPKLNWYRSTQFRIETLEETQTFNESATGDEIYVDNEALVYTGQTKRS